MLTFFNSRFNLTFAFYFFFLLQAAANLSLMLLTPSWTVGCYIIGISSLIAAISVLPIKLLTRWPNVATVYMVLASVVSSLLIVVDYFTYYHFGVVLTQDVVDIIYETNPSETSEFFTTYLTVGKAFIFGGGILLLNGVCYFAAKALSKFRLSRLAACVLTLWGACVFGFGLYSYIRYHNGYSIPQYSTITRVVHSLNILKQNVNYNNVILQNSRELINNERNVLANDSLIVVLVIGESHSRHHTPAYGYGKDNMPRMEELSRDSSMTWLNDVVAASDHTHGVMYSLFTHHLPSTDKKVIFPAVFKALGYSAYLYDNQYFAGVGINVINDVSLSKLLYDERNTDVMSDERLVHQGDKLRAKRRLMIYHLLGSHYTYAQRYPHDRFGRFSEADYGQEFTETQREILAHYDNSILYTDYSLYSLISRLRHDNAVVVYLSDHGEEVYDVDDYIGHGNASMRKDMSYQLRVPMFVWMSPKYISSHFEQYAALKQNAGKPYITSNVSDLLLDLADAPSDVYNVTNSIANPAYKPGKRIVLHSVDFDELCISNGLLNK